MGAPAGGGAADAPRILLETDRLIAVDKPAGNIVHGDGTGTRNLTDLLRARLAERGGDGTARAGELQPLQRLDRDTSGIVLFSAAKATQPAYDRLIAEHRMEKTYLAIACGVPAWDERTLTWPICRDRHDARRMRTGRAGKPAVTHVRVLDARRCPQGPLALLEVRIETGRKHQIRVHLARAGLPIAGDALYGRAAGAGLMLHAARLSFADPVDGAAIDIASPAPERMRALFPRTLRTR